MRTVTAYDGRLLARIIHLAHRFGCTYTRAASERTGVAYRMEFAFAGPSDALRRLDAQITKLLDDDKETME
ncbi:MAG TPA: hypothetical protein VMD47_07175 [Candidatus Acidoferrales bacterium]|nr:hypothetical protein [Candidatus Acidoferrales bacterium]